ncbi:MAG: helix-turn-helix transcriptional regulator [Oscillospiraceae bacterium]|nr:helix-turn-helix transcriptional regulator [Oscillospiraceae bacterium]
MAENNMFTEIQFMVFNRIALAHTLIDNDYRYELKNVGYGTYGKTPKCGGIMEIGFVEQNPVILKGEKGEFTIEENGIFIIPPESQFSVSTKEPGLHRHTSVEFLGRFMTKPAEGYVPPRYKYITLPLYIPPAPENAEICALIRDIVRSKISQENRTYFHDCSDFMTLLQKLCERMQSADLDSVSPGNRRHCARAKAYISQNIHRQITVAEIAESIGVSKNYLTNVFSGSEGLPLTEYINRSKLSYMMTLVRRYGYTLAQAGKHVGFSDVNYISRIFKRYYGMTVTEYKRSFDKNEIIKED